MRHLAFFALALIMLSATPSPTQAGRITSGKMPCGKVFACGLAADPTAMTNLGNQCVGMHFSMPSPYFDTRGLSGYCLVPLPQAKKTSGFNTTASCCITQARDGSANCEMFCERIAER